MRILGASIFSKSFGGKILDFQTAVTSENDKTEHEERLPWKNIVRVK